MSRISFNCSLNNNAHKLGYRTLCFKGVRRIRKKPTIFCAVSENGNVPYLNLNDETPELNNNSDDNANPNFGSVSVSRGSIALAFKGFYPSAEHLSDFLKMSFKL